MSLRKLVGFIHPRIAVVLHDLAMAVLAWWIAKLLRYALRPDEVISFGILEFPIVLLVQGLIFRWTGLYKSVWRFASLPDLWNIARAVVIGSLFVGVSLFLYDRLEGVPRSVLALYPLLLAALLGVPRLAYRYWKDSRNDLLQNQVAKRVLIVGADRAGEVLSRDLHRDNRYAVVGFVDDKPSLRGASINGHPMLGQLDQLPEVAREVAIDMLLIALPGASTSEMRRVVSLCDATGLPYRTVPRLEDVVAGRAQFNQIKEVAIEDLLGRDTVELDWTAIRETLSGKCVLVTGGGGSIGSELCRQVARLGAQSLTVVEQSEYNLYRISQELRADFPELIFDGILANCGDQVAMRKAFADVRPQVVFHAAAYKHVPLLQNQLRAAFRNNALGTRTVADAACEAGVECFVLISTDKAVNPTSVMGACKRIAEIYCQNLDAHAATRFMTVRFGNVLDSAGSVVPLFRRQIRDGGPVTVTHPEISRYFMTIPEACQLILQTASIGKGGEIFALDMGEPVKIRDLAEQMIRLAGKKPGSEIPIVYTGLRAGEKLFEELFHPLENYSATAHAKIFLAQHREVSWELLQALLHKAAEAAEVFNEEELRRCVSSLLPSFRWSETVQPDNVVSIRRANPEINE
ncbi:MULTISPECIES: polysaccharide biosynthesis protein [Rhodanobacter]|uniref:polysaccharide biosynthesis protein n=1 Tax=Rhodanobacter TaxID=75309 RepID=UPI0002610695|nr:MULTISPECIES: nucleoside-diphosphate sugar epimerase/dehydratase [Rhodanobacter]EIM04192.1 putative nucleoside-diphosphate sugar epimerase [Rhodanobacter denitrificans]UJJ52707.1 polysaccharide biosynthesis protein [Rhodanobacter denitrificans]UJM88913.1 polysaccharide biosynthesis protein [Rhodanobacter denitrificans]UJM95460.1 polysaccharide biosynthesis protein [Rhodanobacter denitrificans]UJM98991.1 polysaccharide biosynthesis protein [Rhodanobacter denitrificans]